MSLCQLMIADYKGIPIDMPPEQAYDAYNLWQGIEYGKGWLAEGYTHDMIGDFDMQDFLRWCCVTLQIRLVRSVT